MVPADHSNKEMDVLGAPLRDESNAGLKEVYVTNEKDTLTKSQLPENKHEQGKIPTEEEKRTLRHVGESLPKAAFLVGVQGLFQNYV